MDKNDQTGSSMQRVASSVLRLLQVSRWSGGAGWERLVDTRKAIDEPTHGEVCDCFTMIGFGHGEGSRRCILVFSPKYRVGDLLETAAQDSAKEKWFMSREGEDCEETDSGDSDRHPL